MDCLSNHYDKMFLGLGSCLTLSSDEYEILLTSVIGYKQNNCVTLSSVTTRFTHEWGEEIHVKTLPQGLNVDLAQTGL